MAEEHTAGVLVGRHVRVSLPCLSTSLAFVVHGSSIGFSATPKDAADQPLLRLGHSGVTFSWDAAGVVEVAASDSGDEHVAIARKPGTARPTIKSDSVEKTVVVNTFDL